MGEWRIVYGPDDFHHLSYMVEHQVRGCFGKMKWKKKMWWHEGHPCFPLTFESKGAAREYIEKEIRYEKGAAKGIQVIEEI